MTEVWKDVPGFEGFYEASSLGRVKSLARKIFVKGGNYPCRSVPEKILSPGKGSNDRLYVVLCRDGKSKTQLLHRVIALSFLGECPVGMEVLHENGDHRDCRVDNLRYGTHHENMQDMIRHGRSTKGVSKSLTEKDVLEIRSLLSKGERVCDLARKYKIGRTTIQLIRSRKSWSHI